MARLLILAAVVAVFCARGANSSGQSPTAAHSLSMDVVPAATGGSTGSASGLRMDLGGKPLGGGWTSAEQRDYSQKREKDDGFTLDVDVRNLARTPDTAKLEWFFYGKDIKGGEPFLFDSGSAPVTALPVQSAKFTLHSKTLHSKVVKQLHTTTGVNALGNAIPPSASVSKSGQKAVGWAVRLVADGEIVVLRGSSPNYELLGRAAVAAAK